MSSPTQQRKPRLQARRHTRYADAMKSWLPAFLLLCAGATPAVADPCKMVPDRGPTPVELDRGRTFSGPVVYVGDGDGLCVALGPSQSQWAEVRLADFYAPELNAPGGQAAKSALARLTFGRRISCKAQGRSYDRIVATCHRDGRALGALLRAAGVEEGGRGR